MAILREAKVWAKPRPKTERRTSSDLTPEEQTNVRTAIRFLVKRFGTYGKLAEAMGAKKRTVVYAAGKRGHVSAGVALRTARAGGVALEEMLSGRWPLADT
ncbi:MAG: hypothetical protein M3O46_07235, partial [Myxococcota bacterium]|nr:hypothetical protein [Myxococcota bacterium]